MRKIVSVISLFILYQAGLAGQSRTVNGKVLDDKGEAVSFATVTEIATKKAVSADAKGVFSLVVTTNLLTVSSAGFQTKNITVSSNSSIEYWGGSAAEATTYLSMPLVNFAMSSGTFKEKISRQKWIALYNRGWEAWIEWRRLDYPLLPPAVHAVSVIPRRYPYPINEQNVNRLNYEAASVAIGGDVVDTKLWWDKF